MEFYNRDSQSDESQIFVIINLVQIDGQSWLIWLKLSLIVGKDVMIIIESRNYRFFEN